LLYNTAFSVLQALSFTLGVFILNDQPLHYDAGLTRRA
jgi:hypothetical protein